MMKNKWKGFFVTMVALIMTSSAVFGAAAPKIIVQGKEVDWKDTEAILQNDQTFVPFRQMFESLGYQVHWDENTKTVTVTDPYKIANDTTVDHKVDGTLWLMSAEARACCYQAFNLAAIKFDQAVAANTANEKLAVIVDIDDTLVDGTSYTCSVLANGPWNDDAWVKWLNSDSPKAIPGALEFCNYVVENGGEIFYITNRISTAREITFEGMKKLGFPLIDENHVFIREDGMTSSKEDRRSAVAKTHKVVLLVGDNLEDFSDSFSPTLGVAARAAAVDQVKADWGEKFIILPNPMYGDWEKTIYKYDKTLSSEEKFELLKEQIYNNR